MRTEYDSYSTDDASYQFAVKEGKYETPFIALQPLNDELEAIKGDVMSLRLAPGTTLAKAEALAKELNANVAYLRLIQYPPYS